MAIPRAIPAYKKRPTLFIPTVPTPLNTKKVYHQRSLSTVRFVGINRLANIMGFLRAKDARASLNEAFEEILPTLVGRFVTVLLMCKVGINVSIAV